MEFERESSDDATCLAWLVQHLHPNGIRCTKCQKVTKHHRETNRPSYACQNCGHHEYPMRGTIFENLGNLAEALVPRDLSHVGHAMQHPRKAVEREIGVQRRLPNPMDLPGADPTSPTNAHGARLNRFGPCWMKTDDFDTRLLPESVAPRTGIYRCERCGLEIVAEKDKELPDESDCVRHGFSDGRQIHLKLSEVRWLLVAAAMTDDY